MFTAIRSMLSDGVNGSVSSKRVVTFLAFLLCAAGFVANVFYGKTVDEGLFNSLMWIVISGLGITGAEKFAPKN